jgi:hypothetical protein
MSNKTKYTWLTSLLTGWGVKECWAKVIAGAVIGALCAAGVLALDGCAVRYSQTASGDIEYTGRIIPVERGEK